MYITTTNTFSPCFETENTKTTILFLDFEAPYLHKIKCKLLNFWSQKCQTIAESIFPSYKNLWTEIKFGFPPKKTRKTIIRFIQGVQLSM